MSCGYPISGNLYLETIPQSSPFLCGISHFQMGCLWHGFTYIIRVPSSKLTWTLADRGWKISFHEKNVIFRGLFSGKLT